MGYKTPKQIKVDYDSLIQITKTIYVDVNRTDNYVEDGSILLPFKTFAQAITLANSKGGGCKIVVAPGTITGDHEFPSNCMIDGSGISITVFSGTITTAATGSVILRNFECGAGTSISCYCLVDDCKFKAVTVNAGGVFRGIQTLQNVVPSFIILGGTETILSNSKIKTDTSGKTIDHQSGLLYIEGCDIHAVHATEPAISSVTAGCQLVLNSSLVVNTGGGPSVDCDNGVSSGTPNVVNGCYGQGTVSAGTTPTWYGSNLISGGPAGAGIIIVAGSLISNDSSVSGTTVKDALETLSAGGGGATDTENMVVATGQSVAAGDILMVSGDGVRKADIGYRVRNSGKFPEPLNAQSLMATSTRARPMCSIGNDRVLYMMQGRNYYGFAFVVSFNQDGSIAAVGSPVTVAQYNDVFDCVTIDDGLSGTGNMCLVSIGYSATGSCSTVTLVVRGVNIDSVSSPLVVDSGGTPIAIGMCKITTTQYLVSYTRGNDLQKIYAVPVTVNLSSMGISSLTLGTGATYTAGALTHTAGSAVALSSTKAIIGFHFNSSLRAVVCAISGTTASFPGSDAQVFLYNASNTYHRLDKIDGTNFVAFGYEANKAQVVPCSEASDVITVGTMATTTTTMYKSIGVLLSATEFMVVGTSGYAVRGSISGSVATMDEHTAHDFKSLINDQGGSLFANIWAQKTGPNRLVVVCEAGVSEGNPIMATLYRDWMTVSERVGIATEAKNAGETCVVQYRGVVTTTGLTAGALYYSASGVLSTTANGDPVGRALSTTKLMLF